MIRMSDSILRKSQVVGTLETICQELEVTDTQRKNAESKYMAVGSWLTATDSPLLRDAEIYPQGSFSLQTIVKPLGRDEYDVDLVCLVPGLSQQMRPSYLKKLIGDRLQMNATYKDMLEEKARCWRISYANDFHLDITPSIFNPSCSLGGELVPDKIVNAWKPSNPRGYRLWFEEHAKLQPQILLMKTGFAEIRKQVEALPGTSRFKGVLPRAVQLCKRHRDIWFSKQGAELAPISIVVTTLVAKSYAYCVTHLNHETEFDLLVDVMRHTTDFIESETVGGALRYYVWNETTAGENFAEKWNHDSRLAQSFFSWRAQALSDLENLVSISGMDQIKMFMSSIFGEKVVLKAGAAITDAVTASRERRALAVGTGVGLVTSGPKSISVRPNTFFGA